MSIATATAGASNQTDHPWSSKKRHRLSEIERRQSEQWRRYMTAIGLKIEFKIAQWPELVETVARRDIDDLELRMAGDKKPDSELFFSLAYGPNKGSANDARFALKAYDQLYERQRMLPDGPERLTAMHEATRLLRRLHAVQVSSASDSTGSRAAVADRLSAPPVYDTHVGVSRYR